MPGLLIAAPSSGAGKTTVTLGLLRALSRRGLAIRGAKSGPDYIDPRFHAAACGAECINLDAWAMHEDRLHALAAGPETLVVEGAMGLFDGAPPDGRGACADLARLLGLPVLLVVDAARMAQSVAPLVAGFARFDPEVRIGGVVLNRVGSPRHETMLCRALDAIGMPVLGALPRAEGIAHPSRHLGLVQAEERQDLEAFLDRAADLVSAHIDLDAVLALADRAAPRPSASGPRTPPPAQRIALARDAAFAFAYPHLLKDWRAQGAEITTFSPLADEAVPEADLVLLPGGYPELHTGRLAAAQIFMQSLRKASYTSDIYGECGGYMTLGETLTDADGHVHRMAGLLELATSFERRRLHLGYRRVETSHGPFAGRWAAHEFHYATTLSAKGTPLFEAVDAEGAALQPMGLRRGRVCGSFAHLIDRA
ncbi:cobyrinic acid a,c-diamide synthase [Limimaricola variabilis]|uniref:Hydrogenobyrinate a,c-diamide synthase n=1 Tax=Limimaricola variabilis TaxID=1492771 RepID=A0ABR6HK82_9RHOB|nr:cobyrinate a,c-diamide synthase [Limimaricola variabilis]MBB3710958.1 cobyrinic acid a,c-diamide synthase [Limimaricola variabilis]